MFGIARKRKWRKKGNKPVSIRKDADNNPEDGVSVDQLKSTQPVVVPHISSKLTSMRILGHPSHGGPF